MRENRTQGSVRGAPSNGRLYRDADKNMTIANQERRDCNESALKCFGTAYIFEQRASPLRFGIKVLTFSSLIGPLAIGALVLSVGADGEIIKPAIWGASTLSVVQIIVSLWALVCRWQEHLAYYLESKADNYQLSDRYKDLANNTTYSDKKWRQEFEILETIGRMRSQQDLRFDICDEEKRMGMRAALRNVQRECVGCKNIPHSMQSSGCSVCGEFKQRKIKWLM